MKRIRASIAKRLSNDSGLTLIEIIVSITILGIIAVGVAYSLASILRITNDARSRQVAVNLAAEAIDDSRSIKNVFTVGIDTTTRDVADVTYTIERTSKWVTDLNADAQCGAAGGVTAGGSFAFKRINVKVSWEGMRGTAVASDTVIAPNERINEENKGTILVSVQLASGSGAENLTINAVPSAVPNGAVPITVPILPTDGDGCTYILKVIPGNYDISITKAGWIDLDQKTTPVKTVSVAAEASISAGFQFDQAATYTLDYGVAVAPAVQKPLNLNVLFSNTYGDTLVSNPAASGTQLHPFGSGYQVIAGAPSAPAGANLGCLAPDPSNWPVRAADGAVGARYPAATAAPGTTVTIPLAMGRVTLNSVNGSFLTAVSQTNASSSPDDPGCATSMKYNFAKITTANATIALPYGSWLIYKGSTLGDLNSQLNPVAVLPTDTIAGKIITLDPRRVL